jgi:hypothetical protein
VGGLEGVGQVNVGFDVLTPDEKQSLQQRLGRPGGLPEGAVSVTLDIYASLFRDSEQKAAEMLNEFLASQGAEQARAAEV